MHACMGLQRRMLSDAASFRQETHNSAYSGASIPRGVSLQAQVSSPVAAFTPSKTSPSIHQVTKDTMTSMDAAEQDSKSRISLDSSNFDR